ncbi:hypothetical protein [Pseudorhizobium xiangyangii]|nr:hypothetical protein [Neorhizobium xiangyangii]
MIGMKTKLGTVGAERGSPDGRLMVRISDRWVFADEIEAVA